MRSADRIPCLSKKQQSRAWSRALDRYVGSFFVDAETLPAGSPTVRPTSRHNRKVYDHRNTTHVQWFGRTKPKFLCPYAGFASAAPRSASTTSHGKFASDRTTFALYVGRTNPNFESGLVYGGVNSTTSIAQYDPGGRLPRRVYLEECLQVRRQRGRKRVGGTRESYGDSAKAPINAGAWTFCRMHSPTVDGSESSRSS